MAETTKPKMQLRDGLPNINANNMDKSPSPATKLLINHGKPNFTIQRSPKVQQKDINPFAIQPKINSNYSAFKSASYQNNNVIVGTKFNGVFTPSNLAITSLNGENEVGKVVLRRAKVVEAPARDGEDDNVPEFIRRQRLIQERLAKENVLDFEKRRSGYFTHVMISPDSPVRTSFVETMSSPAIVPALEIQSQQSTQQTSSAEEQTNEVTVALNKSAQIVTEPKVEQGTIERVATNGETEVESDIAQAIEEVNNALAGEDDAIEPIAIAVTSAILEPEPVATLAAEEDAVVENVAVMVTPTTLEPENEAAQAEQPPMVETVAIAVTSAILEPEAEPIQIKKQAIDSVAAAQLIYIEPQIEVAPAQNGHFAEAAQNEHFAEAEQNDYSDGITISHTNGVNNGPSIPNPDPSGIRGVNYESKTVVSFAQELGSGENKYPDTVKCIKEVETSTKPPVDEVLQKMAHLKFEIKADEYDVQVTPVIKTE